MTKENIYEANLVVVKLEGELTKPIDDETGISQVDSLDEVFTEK